MYPHNFMSVQEHVCQVEHDWVFRRDNTGGTVTKI